MSYIFSVSCTFLFIMMHHVPFGNAIRLSSDEAYATSEPDPVDEWHMDYVPTGYLPDSVYRELAWFGILQVQPLYRSTKHKVAARWVWQNTLGRPHVVMENSQTSRNEETVGHETQIEESAKWTRQQRMVQEVLMENIRFGGNGITVRTVISSHKKTVYIIDNGKYFTCEGGSEPDLDAFRTQANIHERKCTKDNEPVPLPLVVDPCIEGEHTPLEYSFIDQWMFCLGDGERVAGHLPNGDLDCGEKIRMRFSDFLKECAIDNNVVISYEYFGDEPRKDMVHNTTICTSWDPCRISYLYRIEVPEAPEAPTTTPDPCVTTRCPTCEEGFNDALQYENYDKNEELHTDANSNYSFIAGASGWLKFHRKPATFDEAKAICNLEDAVLASPISVAVRDAIKQYISPSPYKFATKIHTGVEAELYTGYFLSRERVPLSSMPVTTDSDVPKLTTDPRRCVVWNTHDHTAKYVTCDVKQPYVCYKKRGPVQIVGCGTDQAYKADLRTNRCYKLNMNDDNWSGAYVKCIAEGAELAIINSETEAMVMKQIIIGHRRVHAFVNGRNWNQDRKTWLVEGKSLEATGFSKWDKNQPDNHFEEYCVTLRSNGYLNDLSCEHKTCYICEKNIRSMNV